VITPIPINCAGKVKGKKKKCRIHSITTFYFFNCLEDSGGRKREEKTRGGGRKKKRRKEVSPNQSSIPLLNPYSDEREGGGGEGKKGKEAPMSPNSFSSTSSSWREKGGGEEK